LEVRVDSDPNGLLTFAMFLSCMWGNGSSYAPRWVAAIAAGSAPRYIVRPS